MHNPAAALMSNQHPQEADAQDFDDFIYLMSHDVRASVRALIELPQWIVEDLADAGVQISGPVADSIELLNRHTARLDRMLVYLLAYSRVGRMQDIVEVNLNACIDEVLSGLPMPEGMTLHRDIECDHIRMGEQDALMVWSALIGNAVKHHGNAAAGTVELRTRKEGGVVRFTVRDDGPGIPERHYAKALSAMTTLRPRDEVEGTGMGLANVRKVAAYYGGYIQLSDAAPGLCVDLVLPDGHF